MAELLGVGLVALEIVQRGLQDVAGLLVGADHMDRVADRLHGLLEDEDLVLLGEISDEHQDFLARHGALPIPHWSCRGTAALFRRGLHSTGGGPYHTGLQATTHGIVDFRGLSRLSTSMSCHRAASPLDVWRSQGRIRTNGRMDSRAWPHEWK